MNAHIKLFINIFVWSAMAVFTEMFLTGYIERASFYAVLIAVCIRILKLNWRVTK